MIIILIYLLVILIFFIRIYSHKRTALLQVSTLFWINIIFLIISILYLILYTSYIPILVFTFLTIVSTLIYKLWFLFNYDPQNTQEILENSFSLVLIPFTKTENKYEITLGGYQASVRTVKILPHTALLTFKGNWELNKGRIIQSLFKKKFGSAFPTIVIRLK